MKFSNVWKIKWIYYSFLLVDRFWCEVSVQILWKDIQNYNTLFTCLPNESRELLYENEIIISIQLQSLHYLIMWLLLKTFQ